MRDFEQIKSGFFSPHSSNNHVLQTYAVQDITDNNSPCFPFDDQKKYKVKNFSDLY